MANWFRNRGSRQWPDDEDNTYDEYGRRYSREQPYRGVYDYNRQDYVRGRGYDRPDYGYGQMRGSTWEFDRDYDFNQETGYRTRGSMGEYGNWSGQDYGSQYGYTQRRNPRWDYDFDTDYDEEDYNMPTGWTYTEYWLIQGPFSGFGPQGYQRSDERIREDVNDRLTQHGRVDARNLQVEVNSGEVTLRGTVNSRREKRLAEDAVESIPGVQDVHNEIRVRQQNRGAQQGDREGQPSYQTNMDKPKDETRY
jgi:hypothetical protein